VRRGRSEKKKKKKKGLGGEEIGTIDFASIG
jgi:hypothetical protein